MLCDVAVHDGGVVAHRLGGGVGLHHAARPGHLHAPLGRPALRLVLEHGHQRHLAPATMRTDAQPNKQANAQAGDQGRMHAKQAARASGPCSGTKSASAWMPCASTSSSYMNTQPALVTGYTTSARFPAFTTLVASPSGPTCAARQRPTAQPQCEQAGGARSSVAASSSRGEDTRRTASAMAVACRGTPPK
eukprot:scaffold3536_cov267-Prasinococcus_capsulatus_cf.AAC.1